MRRLLHILNPFVGYYMFKRWLTYTVGLTAFCWYMIARGVAESPRSAWDQDSSPWFNFGLVVLILGGIGWLWWTGAVTYGGVWPDNFLTKKMAYDKAQRETVWAEEKKRLTAERDLRARAEAYGLPLPEVEPMEQIVERVRKEWEAAADPYILDAEWEERPKYLDLPNR